MCLRLFCKNFISRIMKKFISLIAGLSFSLGLFAQGFMGFAVGGNMATLTGDSTSLNKRTPRYGFYLGLTRDIYLDHSTFIQYGLFYSQQGAIYKTEYYYQGLFYRDLKIVKVDYIHIPVVWKQNWDWVYTELGGYVGFVPGTASAIWRQEIFSATKIDTLQGVYNSFASDIQPFDIGLVFGIGEQFKINEQFDMFFDIRYKPGFIKINKGYVAYPEFASKNQVFTFSVGIINIGRAARHRLYYRKLRR